MKRFILCAAVVAIFCGAFISPVDAAHGRGGRAGVHASYRSYPRSYRGWSRTYYCPRYRCNFYFDVSCNGWFYYYAPQQTYLPVSQISTCPPTITIVNNNVVNAPMPADLQLPPS